MLARKNDLPQSQSCIDDNRMYVGNVSGVFITSSK